MIKRLTMKRLCITTLFLLVAIILYSYPSELNKHISEDKPKYTKIYLIDEYNYVSMVDIATNSINMNEQIKDTISSLTIGSKNENKIPNGFKALIPEGTKLIDFTYKDGLLKLNFNSNFLNVTIDNEEKMIESIIYSLTSIKDINKIMIFINGNILKELPNSHKKIDLYLDRSFGINKVYDINTINNTKMITIYYPSKDNSYYIPVSKITNDDKDKIEIIINELKTSTLNNNNLSSQINYQLELMNFELLEQEININFNDILLNSIYNGKLKEEVKYSISYSIYDTLNINKINFLVNGIEIDNFNII